MAVEGVDDDGDLGGRHGCWGGGGGGLLYILGGGSGAGLVVVESRFSLFGGEAHPLPMVTPLRCRLAYLCIDRASEGP